jgi:hypothetical protein
MLVGRTRRLSDTVVDDEILNGSANKYAKQLFQAITRGNSDKGERTASGFNIKQLHGAADHGLLAMGHGGRDTGR